MSAIIQFLTLCVLHQTASQNINPNCDYEENMQLGQEYYLYNSEYPKNYTSSSRCRWVGQSPPGTVIVMSCNEVEIPYSRDCQKDRLSFSPTGDRSFLLDVENYCGKTSFTAFTYTNYFALGLFPAAGTVGGKFVCSVAVMRQTVNCNCGLHFSNKIVGGQEAATREYPSVAAVMDRSTMEAFCGADIISDRYAVTAAHCLLNQQPSNLYLLAGAHDLNPDADKATKRTYTIQGFQKHPLYDSSQQLNDIAILKTGQVITFSEAIYPVCLPFKYREYNFAGDVVTALGWGFQNVGGDKADTLQKVDLNVVTNQQCATSLKQTVPNTEMCTYTPGKDSCFSDSGGPLLYKDSWTNRLELVGIISYGIACATTKPAVNTRVTSYLSWIASVTPDAYYCIQ